MHLAVRIGQVKGITLDGGQFAIHLAGDLADGTIQFDGDVIAAGFEFPAQQVLGIANFTGAVRVEFVNRAVAFGPLADNGAIAAGRT